MVVTALVARFPVASASFQWSPDRVKAPASVAEKSAGTSAPKMPRSSPSLRASIRIGPSTPSKSQGSSIVPLKSTVADGVTAWNSTPNGTEPWRSTAKDWVWAVRRTGVSL